MKDHLVKLTTPWWIVTSMMVLLLFVAAACGDDAETQVFTDDDIGTEVIIGPNEQFEIRLASNPSTGYAWEISAMTSADLVELEERTYISADSGLVGEPGTDVFTFTAGDEGAGILRLEYIRSFDDPIVPERVAEFIIRIDGAEVTPPPGTPPPTNTAVAPG